MPGARHQFAPAVAMKQPIHRTVIDVVPDALGVSLPDLPHRRDLPRFGLREKRSEEALLFFERQILTSPPSLTFRFNRCDAETIVAGDHRMNGCFGHATVPSNLFSGSWLDQGVVDNQPALPRHRALIGSHSMFHFCDGQMGGCMGHSCHFFFSSRFTRSKRLENGQQSTERMRCFASRTLKSDVPAWLSPKHFHKTRVIL
jgi:hypothetical protein